MLMARAGGTAPDARNNAGGGDFGREHWEQGERQGAQGGGRVRDAEKLDPVT